MSLTAIVLAAGQGTRMRSDLPKVMHPLAGRPMVCFVVDAVRGLELDGLVVVVGHGAELVQEALGQDVTYATQAEQLGTAHALQQARLAVPAQTQDVLVLYGDTPLIRTGTLRQMVDHHRSAGATLTLLTFCPGNPAGYGRIVRHAATGQVLGIVEEKQALPEQRAIGEVNSGIYCFRAEWLWPNLAQVKQRPSGEYYLTDLVEMASQQRQRIEAIAGDADELMGVDTRLKLAVAEAEMRRRINEQWMQAGVTLVDPVTTYIEAGVEIGTDTVIWPGTYLQGRSRIGARCTIGPGAMIRDSTVGDQCQVQFSVLEGAVMEEGSNVGPFSHLRKGARLGKGVHVGNFGEIKNSDLGPGVKMGHFSYLGDATVGADVNIGAGTITCNYDGVRKNRTIIGEGAFIGSDTMLVAPVSVGEGAKTGAGAVVTHDVPPGSVAYGVPARVHKPIAEEQDAE